MSTSTTKDVTKESWEERKEREANEFRNKFLPSFFGTMKQHDIDYFTVEFSGSCDDGCVDEPVYVQNSEIPSWTDIRKEVGITDGMTWDNPEYDRLNKKANALHRFYMDPDGIGRKYVYTQMQWDKQPQRYNMNEYIEEFVGMYMSAKSIDWYNNEGGSGTFTFENGELHVQGQTYYRSEDPFEFEESNSEVVKK